jgi:hypothetical protein
MSVEDTLVMIPDDSSSNTRRETGCYDSPISLEDARPILKAFKRRKIDLFSVVNNVLPLVAIAILALLSHCEADGENISCGVKPQHAAHR